MGPGFESLKAHQWPVGQAVKTAASHAANMGSIPVRVTICLPASCVRARIEKFILILVVACAIIKIVGVDCGEGPPVPIPNTEVKLCSADGTWWEAARESRSLPELMQRCIAPLHIFLNSSVGRARGC